MGLIINRIATDITLTGLLKQVRLQAGSDEADGTEDVGDDPGFPMTAIPEALANKQVHFGGPVEPNRGFVLHSDDYADDDMTLSVHDGICLTATIDVLHALLEGRGPSRILVALGYAGWSAGQLEAEIQANGWLHATGDADLIFDTQAADKYDQALARLGIDPAHLSGEAGHA